MAQSFRRLGAQVTVLEAAKILNRDDPELVDILRRRLIDEGLDLREGMAASAVKKDGDGIAVTLSPLGDNAENAPKEEIIKGSHLLVAVGRRPQLAHLGLEKAGIKFTPGGIETDRRLRTSARRVFAIGDVAGRQQFTHIAGYHAGIVIRNMLFGLPARVDDSTVPWVTYTDPELAHVGMTMEMAESAGLAPIRLTASLADNDRARAERRTEGMVVAIITKKGRILGQASSPRMRER